MHFSKLYGKPRLVLHKIRIVLFPYVITVIHLGLFKKLDVTHIVNEIYTYMTLYCMGMFESIQSNLG